MLNTIDIRMESVPYISVQSPSPILLPNNVKNIASEVNKILALYDFTLFNMRI